MSLNPASPLARLIDGPVRPGMLTWIGVRPVRRTPMEERSSASLIANRGIDGDHYDTQRNGARQVTVLAEEDLAAIAKFLGIATVGPALLRRNLVTRGINVMALKGARFHVGSALLEGSGECHPCSQMERLLGPGGYNAVRGHGGITARIIEGAEIRLGDAIVKRSGSA